MKTGKILTTIMTFAITLTLSSAASGHRMLADSLIKEDGTVLIEAFFPDGAPVKGAKVEILKPDSSLFKEGQTDMKGRFTFRPERKSGIWKAVVTGTLGHRAKTEFEIAGGQKMEERTTGAEERELSHREPIPWFKVIAGLGFIFGLSSFIMVLKLRTDLKRKQSAPPRDR